MTFPKLLPLILATLASTALADTVTVTALQNDGDSIGQYVIGGQTYWWLCIEPGPASLENRTVTAPVYSFAQGWDKQNTERYAIYQNDQTAFNGDLYNFTLPKQIMVMDYVLDTYLPWSMAGASGTFAEQNGDFTQFNNGSLFYNSLFAVQNFLSETYGKIPVDFTDPSQLSEFNDYYTALGTDPGTRSSIFESILTDLQGKITSGFFNTPYTAQHDYSTLNSFYAEGDTTNNWQDGLIIGFAPVPEPGSAILIAACGLALTLRRRQRIG